MHLGMLVTKVAVLSICTVFNMFLMVAAAGTTKVLSGTTITVIVLAPVKKLEYRNKDANHECVCVCVTRIQRTGKGTLF